MTQLEVQSPPLKPPARPEREPVPVFRPLLEAAEIAACVESLRLGWLGMGSYVGAFERALGEFVGVDPALVVALSTGHASLHLGLLVAGVGPGDEVITPSFNNVADFQAILATGAQPVFCDIDDRTLCIDLAQAESLVTERTKAVIAMDYDCLLCDHDAVAEFARRRGLRVLHDAAHSFGSRHRGQMVGGFSDLTMFSFDPVKTITCIDGGALVVRTEQEANDLREMRLLGMGQPSSVMYRNSRAWTYGVERLGFRYHMANLHAALGLVQLGKMEDISRTRRETCRHYNARLSGIPGLRVPETDFEDVTPFLYYVRVADGRRDEFRRHLAAEGVDTGIHWQPGHWFELFSKCRRGDLSVTERVGREIVSLPLHSKMSGEARERVVAAVLSFFGR
ncbi:MAG: DegT/DnrJ/EryC1/StrS family aminotransferase [Planctomycetales bacterium]